MGAEALLKVMLSPGEYADYLAKVQEVNDFNVPLEDAVVKKSNDNIDIIDRELKLIEEKAGEVDLTALATKRELQVVKDDGAEHKADDVRHITSDERTSWNGKQSALPPENRRKITLGTTDPSAW